MSMELDRRTGDRHAEAGTVESAPPPTEAVTPETSERPLPRKADFWIVPIPKNRRHQPGLDADAEFGFTWRINVAFAAAAVSYAAGEKRQSLTYRLYR
jgi:hypothetical protein